MSFTHVKVYIINLKGQEYERSAYFKFIRRNKYCK